MANNAFLILLLVAAGVLGALGGYFVFLGVYQEQFSQQERITLENFDSVSAILYGTIIAIEDNSITVERQEVRFRVQITDDTYVLLPNENIPPDVLELGRAPVTEGSFDDLKLNQQVELTVAYNEGIFKALRISVSPQLER